MAAKAARPQNPGALVQSAGGGELFANHDWHGGGSGSFGPGGQDDCRLSHVAHDVYYQELTVTYLMQSGKCFGKTFLCSLHDSC
jgi:hypothetical protein